MDIGEYIEFDRKGWRIKRLLVIDDFELAEIGDISSPSPKLKIWLQNIDLTRLYILPYCLVFDTHAEKWGQAE